MDDRRCHYVEIRSNVESDGRLLVVEQNTDTMPFEIKRIFWVRDVKEGAERGQHATKRTRLILIAVAGSCNVIVSDGKEEKHFSLNDPTKGLYIDKLLWRTMRDFTPDCVVEAICDSPYAGNDETYEDYEEYLKVLKSDEYNK